MIRSPLGTGPRPGCSLRLEPLEGREVPAALVGLTTAGSLVIFDSATPGVLTSPPVAVTGLQPGETLVGIDYRTNGQLYGVSSASRVYTINPATGAATGSPVPFTPALAGGNFGVDFNPVADRIRVVSDTGQSLRVNPTTPPTATADPALFYDTAAPENTGFFTGAFPAPNLVAAGYTLNVDQTTGANVTTLYAIDAAQDLLVRVGGPDGDPTPNNSQVFVVGELRAPNFALIDFGTGAGLDVVAGTDDAFASNGATVYSVDLTTATVTSLGAVGGGFALADLAVVVAPPAAGVGSVALPAGAFTFPASRTPLAVTVTRTGGATGAVSIDYATADGTAVGGVDYLPTSGTLNFASGETSRTIFLLLPSGTPPNGPAKTFTLTLSNPTGGLALATPASATVTIPAVAVPATRFTATGSGQDARVTVFDVNNGGALFTFRAFEGRFAGEAHVAVGDVNADGYDDVIVGAGAGAQPRVQVFDGRTLSATNQTQLASFLAFDAGFRGGVNVGAGDVTGDGFADVVVGAGPGAGAHVKVFDGRALANVQVVERASYFAYTGFNGGVTVSAGNFNGDGFDDVVTGAGAGGGPHVKVFSGQTLVAGRQTELASFFAFDRGYLQGISVAAGDIDGDSIADVVVGARTGPGHVKVFDGRALRTGTVTERASLLTFGVGFLGGATVAAADLNRDGSDDVFVGAGPGGGSRVVVLDGRALATNGRAELRSFLAYDASVRGGVFVG